MVGWKAARLVEWTADQWGSTLVAKMVGWWAVKTVCSKVASMAANWVAC